MRLSIIFAGVFAMLMASCSADNPGLDNDLITLNYALTLEHLEAAFYQQFQSQFSATDFVNAGFASGVYDYLGVVAAHEMAHVAALTTTIMSLGGTPVEACTYDFSMVTNVTTYLTIAAALEGTGVSAYDGALNTLSDPDLQQVAATIATVEARHAAYVNNLMGAYPWPGALDNPLSPDAVATAAAGFFLSCPDALELPTIRPGGVATDMMGNVVQTGDSRFYGEYTAEQMENDIDTLNYALTLEHLEAAFYMTYLDMFSQAQFMAAGFNSTVYSYLSMIGAHESAHVSALTATITGRGADPVPACTYDFGQINTVADFLTAAAGLEGTGVSAYDGAANTLTDTNLQQVAATIATIEARHASYLRNLVGMPPFPANFDTPVAPADIIAAVVAAGYVTSCPDGYSPATMPLPSVITPESPAPEATPTPMPEQPTPTPSPSMTASPGANNKRTTMNFNFDGMLSGSSCGCSN